MAAPRARGRPQAWPSARPPSTSGGSGVVAGNSPTVNLAASMDPLRAARAAFDRHAWREAVTHFQAADQAAPLEPADLDRLARACDLSGCDAEAEDASARAYRGWLDQD